MSDDDAVVFSRTFYKKALGEPGTSIGEAVTAARRAVWEHRPEFDRGDTWAAYQHYGDPTDQLVLRPQGSAVGP